MEFIVAFHERNKSTMGSSLVPDLTVACNIFVPPGSIAIQQGHVIYLEVSQDIKTKPSKLYLVSSDKNPEIPGWILKCKKWKVRDIEHNFMKEAPVTLHVVPA